MKRRERGNVSPILEGCLYNSRGSCAGREDVDSFRVKLTEDRHASILFFFLSDWCDNKNKKSGVCVSVLPSAGCCCQNESIQGSLCGNGKFQHKYHLK